MSNPIISQLIQATQQLQLPDNNAPTEHSRRIFLQAVERIDDYKGNPKELAGVLRLLQTADSRPYVMAGVAYTLIEGSKGRDDVYDQEGLEAAMAWLEHAQELDPENFEVNCIESLIYIHEDRLDDARTVLDYLGSLEPNNYYYHAAEVTYWIKVKDVEQIEKWVEKCERSAEFVPQKLRMRIKLGEFYFGEKQFAQAIKVFRDATHFDKNNANLWSLIAIASFRSGDMKEAELANDQTLRIQPDHRTALKLKEALDEKKKEGGSRLGRLFGR